MLGQLEQTKLNVPRQIQAVLPTVAHLIFPNKKQHLGVAIF